MYYSLLNATSLTVPLMAAGSSCAGQLRETWPSMISQIQRAGRDDFVCAQIRDLPGFGKLKRLRGIIKNSDPNLPLDDETQVPKAHKILYDEIAFHPSLYSYSEPTVDNTGVLPLHVDYFHGVDPTEKLVEPLIGDAKRIHNHQGEIIGQAVICAGGVECAIEAHRFKDGSRISASSSGGERIFQEDAFYYAFFEMSAGIFVKILAGSDGMGMYDGSNIAVSGLLQGIHAAVVSAARNGIEPDPVTLYNSGQKAMRKQKKLHENIGQASGTVSLAVILGNRAFIATRGDSTVVHSRRLTDGHYTSIGYSLVDCIGTPHTLLAGADDGPPVLYKILDMKPGERLLIASDGFWENLLSTVFKVRGSFHLRKKFEEQQPDQRLFRNLNYIHKRTYGQLLSAKHYVNLALRDPFTIRKIFGIRRARSFLPWDPIDDNIFVIDYEQGSSPEMDIPSWPLWRYSDLEWILKSEM